MTSQLPEPECRQLAEGLRELKDRTGLSLAGLAEQTPYSKSAWGRYLGGQVLPPREAVEALCQVAHEPKGRHMALWELADLAVSRRGAYELPEPEAESETGAETAPAPVRGRGRVVYAAVVAVVLVSMAGIGFGVSRPARPATPAPSPTGTRCHGKSCAGKSPEGMACGAAPRSLGLHRAATGAQVEIRYSVECGAAWVRIWQSRIGDRIEVSAPGGPARTAKVTDTYDAQGYLFTPMVAVTAGNRVRGCLEPTGGGARECFEGTVGP
jgi:hypothetical protein